MLKKCYVILYFTILIVSCAEKEFDPNNPQLSFAMAKEPYDDKNYEVALKKLGEFKARFPYSKYAVEAELFIANSHFELGHYAESAAAYAQFITLHPKHEQAAYCQYQVGLSYWKDAPEEVDREQEFTEKSLKEWGVLVTQYPQSPFSKQATEFIEQGTKRIADADIFVARFYCKQGIWHACAYRYLQIPAKYPQRKELVMESYKQGAFALEKLANSWAESSKDRNLYFRDMTQNEMIKKVEEMRRMTQ